MIGVVNKENKRTVSTNRTYDHLYKIVVVGAVDVGKTSLTRVFCGEDFRKTEVGTIQSELYTKFLKNGKKSVKLDIYDTAGSERYASLTKSYLRAASGIVLVYDANRPQSLQQSYKIYTKIIDEDDIFKPSVILVGSKSDLGVKITRSEIENIFPLLKHFHHIITSAKTGENLDYIFQLLIDNILKKDQALVLSNEYKKLGTTDNSETSIKESKKDSGCCIIL